MITAVRNVIMPSLEEIYTSCGESCWYSSQGLLGRQRQQAFRNTGIFLPNYMTSHSSRVHVLESPLSEPPIWQAV